MKYIITKNHSPILFSEAEKHSDVAHKFGGAISAGYVSIRDNEVHCYGKSDSLNIGTADRDSEKITTAFRGY